MSKYNAASGLPISAEDQRIAELEEQLKALREAARDEVRRVVANLRPGCALPVSTHKLRALLEVQDES